MLAQPLHPKAHKLPRRLFKLALLIYNLLVFLPTLIALVLYLRARQRAAR